MRRKILIVMLAVMSNSALAAWKQVGSNENTTLYIDPSTIQREGNLAKMWHLTDYRKPTRDISEPYLSAKDQHEYDCKQAKSRRRASSQHSESMGGGKVVYSDSYITRWKPVPPGSGVEVLWKLACGKK